MTSVTLVPGLHTPFARRALISPSPGRTCIDTVQRRAEAPPGPVVDGQNAAAFPTASCQTTECRSRNALQLGPNRTSRESQDTHAPATGRHTARPTLIPGAVHEGHSGSTSCAYALCGAAWHSQTAVPRAIPGSARTGKRRRGTVVPSQPWLSMCRRGHAPKLSAHLIESELSRSGQPAIRDRSSTTRRSEHRAADVRIRPDIHCRIRHTISGRRCILVIFPPP